MEVTIYICFVDAKIIEIVIRPTGRSFQDCNGIQIVAESVRSQFDEAAGHVDFIITDGERKV